MVSTKTLEEIKKGEEAYDAYDFDAALLLFKSALNHLALEPESYQKEKTYGEVFLKIVDVLDLEGKWVDAVMYIQTIANIAQQKNFTQLEMDANIRAGRILLKRSLWKEARIMFEKVLELTNKKKSDPVTSECYYGIAFTHWRLAEMEKAKFNAEKALDIAGDKKGCLGIKGMSLTLLASIADDRGDTDTAIHELEVAINVLQEIDDLIELARAYNNLGEVYKNIEEYAKAIEQFQMCVKVAKSSNNKRGETYAVMNIVECLVRDDKVEEAESKIELVESLLSAVPEPYAKATWHMVNGLIRCAKNDQKGTHREFKSTIDSFEALDVPFDLGMACFEYGRALQIFGRREEGKQMYEKALDNFKRSDAKVFTERAEEALRRVE
jgi:tetratricopeptide (TPR) repeat protein